ncbi:PH domain-containing protein [Bradyrhizobium sp. CB3481]|uniref:PH domain-containing protein n=1 Tax=Bradyrhizobium sp. CB3481 TaxID=3039158 RepID=UPI0024B090A7|nr:PH domain-containing protein [Bradyrhizobium sp. CB3481]WFU19543.1 PH domain-containing protein [Bradyrhizobium sp. CB3481]
MTNSDAAFQRELDAGERLLWSGRPLPDLRIESGSLLHSLFGFVFLGIAVASLLAAGKESSIFPTLWTIPFVVVGLYVSVGHFFWSAFCRRYTEYAVTNQRVIVRSNMPRRTIQSIEYRKIRTITLTEKSDGSGTIQFGESGGADAGDASATRMEAVADARLVYNIIRKASHRLA